MESTGLWWNNENIIIKNKHYLLNCFSLTLDNKFNENLQMLLLELCYQSTRFLHAGSASHRRLPSPEEENMKYIFLHAEENKI